VDLRTLIERCRGDRSLQDLADDSGLSKPTWQTHAQPSDPGKFGRRIPDTDTILGMVKGLRVDPAEVMLAIGETLGVIPPNRPRPELLELLPPVEVLNRLSREDVDTIVRLIGLLADAHRPADPVDPATPAAPEPVPAQVRPRGRTHPAGHVGRVRGDGPEQTTLSFVQATA
jgi:hypothetical protein